ncbi:MAG: porin [Phycisphaeraceae bacterium]
MARTLALGGALATGLAPVAWGAEGNNDRAQRLEQQVRQLQARVAELERSEDGQWMSERRAEEVKALVHEVLADARTRSSLLQEGATAGYDGGFFIQSPDQSFRLKLGGQIQTRYIWNHRDGARDADPDEDDNEAGFQMRRVKIKGGGHIADPRLSYAFIIAGNRSDGGAIVEAFTLGYDLTDNLSITAGRMKAPFALQELTSSSRQLAVERSSVHDTFTLNYTEGVMLSYNAGRFRLAGMVNDGANGDRTDFHEDAVDVAFSGRAVARLAGDWGQLKDPAVAWAGDDTGLFLGGGVHYQVGETGEDMINGDFLRWTADATFESNGFGVLAALYGNHTDMDAGTDFDDYGLLVEAGYFLVPDEIQPFVRYELILQDDARPDVAAGNSDEETSLITAGVNWYQRKHSAKFTADVVYGLDPLRSIVNTSSGLGLRTDAPEEDGQVAFRAQYQLTF